MSVEIRPAPEEVIWTALVGPGMRSYAPTRCWAATRHGERCHKGGTHTWQPVGERVPYAICSVHARQVQATPERFCLLAPQWPEAARSYDQAIKLRLAELSLPVELKIPVWQRY